MSVEAAGLLDVMIVDPRTASRRALRSALEIDPAIGTIEEHGSGKAAIEATERWPADLLFVRMDLPDGSAVELLERMEVGDPATIVVTEDPRDAVRAFEARAVDCRVEPFFLTGTAPTLPLPYTATYGRAAGALSCGKEVIQSGASRKIPRSPSSSRNRG